MWLAVLVPGRAAQGELGVSVHDQIAGPGGAIWPLCRLPDRFHGCELADLVVVGHQRCGSHQGGSSDDSVKRISYRGARNLADGPATALSIGANLESGVCCVDDLVKRFKMRLHEGSFLHEIDQLHESCRGDR
ncbi:MAG: hypothetical protein ACRDRX_14320 [Pseudonocardiaceae bacterium]